MTEKEICRTLGRVDLFRPVKPATLAGMVRACVTHTLTDRQVLFQHGAIGSSLYVVLAGRLEVFRGDRIIATVGPREYIGEMALLDAAPRSAAVRALGNTTLLEVPRDTFDRFLRTQPDALAAIMRTMGRRLRGVLDDTQAAYEHVNMVVHDMLNLLNVLTGAALAMDVLPRGDKHRRFLQRILDVQATLETMMRGALRKARGTPPPYEKTPARIDDLIRECLERDVAFHPDVQRVRVDIRIETPVAPFPCNALDVRRVLANLLLNAAQACAPGGSVVVSARQDRRAVTLSVTDNGRGIPPDIRPWVFEPHFSAKTDGIGLGLSSCKDIVERLHQGRLTFESTEGRGTTFVCEFPARLVEGRATPGVEAREAPTTRPGQPGRPAATRRPRSPARTRRPALPSRAGRRGRP